MSKHTPGPWSVGGKYKNPTVLVNAKGESIASGGNNRAVVGEELEASLRLAAAAPELLASLQLLVAHLDRGAYSGVMMPDVHTMHAARTAITKATKP